MSFISVVVPCFNEADRLDGVRFIEFAASHSQFRFLFVDDGSSDRTLEVLQSLQSQLPDQISILSLDQNCGKAEAVRRGVVQAIQSGAHCVAYWDADLATPLEDLLAMERLLHRHPALQMVLGSRMTLLGRRIERQRLRKLLGRVFATIASRVIRLKIYDTQCGAKMFRVSKSTMAMFGEPFRSRWIFDVELLARWLTLWRSSGRVSEMIYEMPLDRWEDVAGSKVKGRDFVRAFGELVSIGWHYRLRSWRSASLATPMMAADSESWMPRKAA